MIHKITVKDNTKESNVLLFHEVDLDTIPDLRIVPLFGANGAGKTTLIRGIENSFHYMRKLEQVRDRMAEDQRHANRFKPQEQEVIKKIPFNMELDTGKHVLLRYRNSDDNWRMRDAHTYSEAFDPSYINAKWDAQSISEGQSIIYSVDALFKGLKNGDENIVPKDSQVIVLLDELDSGLSLDNLDACLRTIRSIVHKHDNVQIFMSFNTSYVLKYFPDILSMYTGQIMRIKDENAMLQEILAHKKELDKLRKRGGKYKVFD